MRSRRRGSLPEMPLRDSGLRQWLDADHGITTPGGVVTTWLDRGPLGKNGTGVASPTHSPADSNFRNQGSVTLNGTSQYFTADGVAGDIDGDDTPFTQIVVARSVLIDGSTRVLLSAGNSGSTVQYSFLAQATTSGNVQYDRRDDGAAVSAAGTPASVVNTPYIYVVRFNGTTVDGWRNGGAKLTGLSAAPMDKAAVTWNQYTLGCFRRTGVGNFFAGQITNSLVYQPNPSLDFLNDLVEYLGIRYGITTAEMV